MCLVELSDIFRWLFKGKGAAFFKGIQEIYKIFILTASLVQEHSSFTSLNNQSKCNY